VVVTHPLLGVRPLDESALFASCAGSGAAGGGSLFRSTSRLLQGSRQAASSAKARLLTRVRSLSESRSRARSASDSLLSPMHLRIPVSVASVSVPTRIADSAAAEEE
jgi:hypothetical protein